MGVTHPSRILQSGKERGLHPYSFGERLDAPRKAELCPVLGHPGPTFHVHFWGCLYRGLLSLFCAHHTMNQSRLH